MHTTQNVEAAIKIGITQKPEDYLEKLDAVSVRELCFDLELVDFALLDESGKIIERKSPMMIIGGYSVRRALPNASKLQSLNLDPKSIQIPQEILKDISDSGLWLSLIHI